MRSQITIVTPCLNGLPFVGEAIESVLEQDFHNVEHIIVDGGSSDGTLDILKRYPHLRVTIEPDQGLYDALNKGIRLAQGEIIGHLNSDDFYEPRIFGEVAQCFARNPHADALCGGAVVFEGRPDGSRRIVAEYQAPSDKELSLQNITFGVPITNARFFRKSVYERVGLYDLRYRIAADRDFLMRAALAGTKSVYLDRPVYHYRQHPRSLTIQANSPHTAATRREYLEIAENYLNEKRLPPDARHCCRVWHGRVIGEMGLDALRKGRFGNALRYAIRGLGFNRRWPLAFASFLCLKFLRLGSRAAR